MHGSRSKIPSKKFRLYIYIYIYTTLNFWYYFELHIYTALVGLGLNYDHCLELWTDVNPLAPSGHYNGRTAQLTSRHFILNIYSTNIRTILNMLPNLRFFLFKMPFIS